MPKPNDLSRSFTAFEQDSKLITVIEMSLTSWLVAGILPSIERHRLKKLDVDERLFCNYCIAGACLHPGGGLHVRLRAIVPGHLGYH